MMDDQPEVKFRKVLEAAQKNRASHQKCLHILDGIYKKMGTDKFKQIFLKFLKAIFTTETLAGKNENVERVLEFLAQFVVQTIPTEDNETIPDDPFEDVPTHPFFTEIVMETLKYHFSTNASLRYNSCLYQRLLLQNISSNVNVDYDVCERIMEAMLERTRDIKPSIRLQAVMALVKLQDPSDPDCPVIKAYLNLLTDGNPMVRSEVVKRIAAYVGSAPYIMKHLRDVDASVRLQAFRRCADMGPKIFKIYERQDILMCGLMETHEKVKKSFQENLLIKWLNTYEGDFIKLLNSIKIDADESDMLKTQDISKSLMDIYFRIRPIRDVIASLPLNEEKLIPQDQMAAEVILLWDFLVQHVRKCSGDLNMDLEEILPELTPFCEYIQRLIDNAKGKNMEDWEYLEYQHILFSLFQIAEGYDFSDEVGRKKLNQMVMRLLTDEKTHLRIKRKLLKIASELYLKSEDITTDVCCLISDIREPLIEVEEELLPPAPSKFDNHDFQVATLKVKLNTLEEDMEEAADSRDFLRAEQLNEQAQKIKEELAQLVESRSVPQIKTLQVKTVKDDPKTVCHCLDLLISLLELPSVRSISTALETVKNEFLLPLLESSVAEINWRVLQCLALFANMSIELAEEYLKVLCIPLMTCRMVPNYNKFALRVSIKSIADLYHLYGDKIFGGFNNISSSNTTHTRRLYDDGFDGNVNDPTKFHFENIIDILLDLIDEEDVEIYQYSIKALNRLLLTNFPVSPSFIVRIILKWYNPTTGKSTNQVQQPLGMLIVNYACKVKGAKEIIAKAVFPILRNVACVPKADPLSEIDTDNLLNYLAAITRSVDEKEASDLHLKLTRVIIAEIGKCRNPVLLGYMTKLLTFLNIPVGDEELVNDIIGNAETLVEDESVPLDKSAIKCIQKFIQKVKDLIEVKNKEKEHENEENRDTESTEDHNGNSNHVDSRADSSIRKTAEKNIEKGSCNSGEDSIQEIHTNNENKDASPFANENNHASKKLRKNGMDEMCQPTNMKEVPKINSKTDTNNISSHIRKGMRECKPNRKYGEDKPEYSSNNRVKGHLSVQSNPSDGTVEKANACGDKSTDDSDPRSPIRKKARLIKNNNGKLQCRNDEIKRGTSIGSEGAKTRSKQLTVLGKIDNVNNRATKQPVNNKGKIIEDSRKIKMKNGAKIAGKVGHKIGSKSSDTDTESSSNTEKHIGADICIPLRRTTRYSNNLSQEKDDKVMEKVDMARKSKYADGHATTKQKGLNRLSKMSELNDGSESSSNIKTDSSPSEVITRGPSKRSQGEQKNGKFKKKDKEVGKNDDLLMDSRRSTDKASGDKDDRRAKIRDTKTREVNRGSSNKQAVSDTRQNRNRYDKLLDKNNEDGRKRDVVANKKYSKLNKNPASTNDSNPRDLDKRSESSSKMKPDSSSSEAGTRSPLRRPQGEQKNGKFKKKDKKVGKNDDLLMDFRRSTDAASGDKKDDRRAKIIDRNLIHTLDKRMKKRMVLSKENRNIHSGTDSKKTPSDSEHTSTDTEHTSTDSEMVQPRSKRPRLAHLEKEMTKCTRLDSAVLSEHNEASYSKTFRPIAESTACVLQITSEVNPNRLKNRTLTRSLSRLSEQSESRLNNTRDSDRSLLALANNIRLKRASFSSFDSEVSSETRSSRSTKSSARSSPIISRALRKYDIPNIIKDLRDRKIQMK